VVLQPAGERFMVAPLGLLTPPRGTIVLRRIEMNQAFVASGLLLGLGAAFALFALHQLRATTERLDAVVSEQAEVVIRAERLRAANEQMSRAARGYLLTADERLLDEMQDARDTFARIAAELLRTVSDDELRGAITAIQDLHARYHAAMDRLVRMRPMDGERLRASFDSDVRPIRAELSGALDELGRAQGSRFTELRESARRSSLRAERIVLGVALAALTVAIALTFAIARILVLLGRSRAELHGSNERLSATNRDLDAFAGRIAHDLRNVLGPLRLLGARLKQVAADPAAVRSSAARLEAVSQRSERLLEALLAFARGRQSVDDDAVASLAAAVREAVDDVAPLASEVDAKLSVDAQDASVRCSPGLLHTVLVNLLGNALKFLRGRPVREVSVSARVQAARCEIAVSDTGPGIPEEWREKVFAPFVRVPGSEAAGSGIGLATVHRIVQAHGGDIRALPRAGGGTTFVFHLPVADEATADAGTAAGP
jgi:signal transduction histidine kinase